MEKTIVSYGSLGEAQKAEAVELFLVGFGRFMTFSKDEALKRKLFLEILDPDWFFCCLEGEKVLGLMGLGTREKRPIYFKPELCRALFGERKGRLISRQMNAVFQSRAVSGARDLYLDTLVTAPAARRQGIAAALLERACALGNFDALYTEVFSKNENARRFYETQGFVTVKKERFSILRLQGAGYPVKMRKTLPGAGEGEAEGTNRICPPGAPGQA